MAKANIEQLKAIEHNGGVLLKAGAGSGKTFVLKEHVIYLTRKWMQEYLASSSINDFSQFIKSKFSKIVLMTFTKKAAGEISIRLNKEFNQLLDESEDREKELWKQAVEQLDFLTVTTIHGFCFKLIKQGFFPYVDLDEDVINEAQFDEKMSALFDLWLEKKLKQNSENHEFADLILKDQDNIFSSVKSIFADPSLRKMWSQMSPQKMNKDDFNQIIKDLVDVFGLNKIVEEKVNIDLYNDFEGKKWYDFLASFDSINKGIQSFDDLISFYNFFKQLDFKIPTTPRAKGVDESIKGYYIAIKELKDFLKSNGEDLNMYHKHQDGLIQNWFNKYYEIINFIEEHYRDLPGITFSDLEYIVSKGLEKKEVAQAIGESYDYLIVDEFQDTSYIQFEIISQIIGNNFKKLFCVGDIKQAIYGFRGGELGVFLNCQKLVPKVLSLKNNYRSDQSIIRFNNNFFDFLFAKGLKFQGNDVKPVEVEYQEVPLEERPLGHLYRLDIDCEFLEEFSIEKLNNDDIEYLEALALCEKLKALSSTNEKSAVLYKKLKPSLLLIGLMIEESMSFTAQVKIPFGEDPVLGLFRSLVEYDFNTNKFRDAYLKLILTAYINLLDSTHPTNIDLAIDKFMTKEKYFGLYQSFSIFMDELGFSNSNYSNNLNYIKTLCRLAGEDKEKILSLLLQESDNKYSLDFQYGQNPKSINLMTAHASKGLQFPHILLGGIYTNDKSFPFTSLLGKLPHSFKWGELLTSKQKFKTPQYLLETQVNKYKEFSESKRLFYVACTRAQNTVSWVNLNFGKIKNRKQSGSWKSGIDSWYENEFKENREIQKLINLEKINIADKFSKTFLEQAANRKPLFHIDPLGIVSKDSLDNNLLILPELSVTRLTSLVDCPRKFYLGNICKMTQEDIDILNIKEPTIEENKNEFIDFEDELTSKSFRSSAERGTQIHEKLDQIISADFDIQAIDLDITIDSGILWAVDNLKDYRDNFNFRSEKEMKFELFNYMISGIPDLILLPKDTDEDAQIWDYKTGQRTENKENTYFFQLMCYAYALYHHEGQNHTKKTKLVICYIDEQKVVEKNISSVDVDNYLNDYWEKINSPHLTNPEACKRCLYKNICQK